jgi:hypothetical protein
MLVSLFFFGQGMQRMCNMSSVALVGAPVVEENAPSEILG